MSRKILREPPIFFVVHIPVQTVYSVSLFIDGKQAIFDTETEH
jgi:hypothetical protein